MRFLLSLFIALTLSTVALADDSNTIAKVEKYLNSITTLKANFVQTHSEGTKVTGKFMLNRPGKLRFEYDAPLDDFIVADGFFIHFYDGEMKQQSSTTIKNSLANFFLRDRIEITGDITISDVKEDDKNIQLTITKTEATESGSLALFFHKNPMQLYKWEIVDAQGITTSIALKDIENGVKFDEDLFFYYDPERKESNINR